MTPTPARLFLALLALLLLGLLADRYVDPNPTWAVPSPPKPAPTASLEVPKAMQRTGRVCDASSGRGGPPRSPRLKTESVAASRR